jgi:hypothetical protein
LESKQKYFPNIKVIERTYYKYNKKGGDNGVPEMPPGKLELMKTYIDQLNSVIPIKK